MSRQVEAAVDRVMDTSGRIDMLVDNAGMCIVQAVEEMTDASLDAVLGVNLKGTFNTMQDMAPITKRQRFGKVINISSAGGIKAMSHVSHYAASKGGVIAATRLGQAAASDPAPNPVG